MDITLHKYLRSIRIENGELLKDMADKLNMTASELSAIEHGKKEAPKGFMNKIESLYLVKDNLSEAAYIQEIRGFVGLMKDIDEEDNLKESSKPLLTYLTFLLESIDKKDELISSLVEKEG